jgi:putative transposase
LKEIYGVEVSPSLISTVTEEPGPGHKAIYPAFGVNLQGLKEVLGMWASESEGAKFWMHIVTELKTRGVQDIFIACVDGLKGFPEATGAIFSKTQVHLLCLLHLVRHALSYVSHRDRKEVATDLKSIYQAVTLSEAERHLIFADARRQFTEPAPQTIVLAS